MRPKMKVFKTARDSLVLNMGPRTSRTSYSYTVHDFRLPPLFYGNFALLGRFTA